MIEARIECLCPEFKITDLGLDLVKGDVEWVSQARANASSELRHAKAIKAVDVRLIKRGETVDPSRRIPWIHGKAGKQPTQRPNRSAPAPAPAQVPVPAPAQVPAPLSAEEIRQITREEMRAARRELKEEVGAEVQRALASRGDGDSLTKADVADVLREVLGALPAAAPAVAGPRTAQRAVVVDDGDPVFIPSDIGAGVTKSEISVEAGEFKASDSFDETAKAMKEAAAARPKRARKPRK